MRLEHVDHRVLGAIRFVDAATGVDVQEPLLVTAPGVRWIRNQSGWYVIAGAQGLEAHVDAFLAPPTAPPLETVAVTLTVRDPRGRYLPRAHTLRLPRDPDPQHDAAANSLFRTMDVALFSAPVTRPPSGWAAVRASVTVAGTGAPVAGALIRVVRTGDGHHLASGLTDPRGEGLVPVPGIPLTTSEAGPGPVVATEVEVTVEVIVDPAVTGVSDPDDLETRRAALRVASSNAMLASGRVLVASFSVVLP
jgi:hypothetical protein